MRARQTASILLRIIADCSCTKTHLNLGFKIAVYKNMTSEATAGQIPDVYGQVHPEETIDFISKKRKELEFELEKIPAAEKTNLAQAQEKCPELLSDAFKLKFLRSEVFNADVSKLVCEQGIAASLRHNCPLT